MPISNTSRSLTASDLKVVAELMAKDPEFAKEAGRGDLGEAR